MKKKTKKAAHTRHTVLSDGPDPIDVHVGHRLRQARHLADLSQMELGAGIGVSFQAVQKYEQGENRISASRLYNAAKLLQCSVSFFFEGLEPSATTASGTALDSKEIDLIRAMRRITDQGMRDHLRQFIRQVAMAQDEADPQSETA